ncbi:MAG: response regulator [Deltaproteobacteria bacterium]|nr:response regulator [Deltaproteobacteria bacterium]
MKRLKIVPLSRRYRFFDSSLLVHFLHVFNGIMKKKILVVEDDIALSNILHITLKKSYDVCMARNGREGVELAASENPDLILMDIKMPEMDGWEALSILRGNDVTASIPVIFLSGLGQFDDILKGFRLGADNYITKPFTKDDLFDGIEMVLSRGKTPTTTVSQPLYA